MHIYICIYIYIYIVISRICQRNGTWQITTAIGYCLAINASLYIIDINILFLFIYIAILIVRIFAWAAGLWCVIVQLHTLASFSARLYLFPHVASIDLWNYHRYKVRAGAGELLYQYRSENRTAATNKSGGQGRSIDRPSTRLSQRPSRQVSQLTS